MWNLGGTTATPTQTGHRLILSHCNAPPQHPNRAMAARRTGIAPTIDVPRVRRHHLIRLGNPLSRRERPLRRGPRIFDQVDRTTAPRDDPPGASERPGKCARSQAHGRERNERDPPPG